MSWVNRFRLQEVQKAASNLADQIGVPSGRVRVVFQTVTDVAVLGTVLVSGALAAVHLYKALLPRHKKEDDHSPEAAGGDRSPPHRRGPRVAPAFADGDDGHQNKAHRSR
jgi:hypothetical protein